MPNRPYDDVDRIEFPDQHACFTGTVTYKRIKGGAKAVTNRGGDGQHGACSSTDDLVVGKQGSPRLKHDDYGKKIADALKHKEQGKRIEIMRAKK
jgi:hypothetical protein